MMEKSESVRTQAKPCEPPRRRRCLDIEYKRKHGCIDTIDLVISIAASGLFGIGLGLMIGLAAGGG